MTREEKLDFLLKLPSETISPSVMALVDGGDPYTFNLMAKEGKLDIPHYWRGRNLRIWKGPVIKMIEGETSVQAGENKQALSRYETEML